VLTLIIWLKGKSRQQNIKYLVVLFFYTINSFVTHFKSKQAKKKLWINISILKWIEKNDKKAERTKKSFFFLRISAVQFNYKWVIMQRLGHCYDFKRICIQKINRLRIRSTPFHSGDKELSSNGCVLYILFYWVNSAVPLLTTLFCSSFILTDEGDPTLQFAVG
jgi:hypothetical protein